MVWQYAESPFFVYIHFIFYKYMDKKILKLGLILMLLVAVVYLCGRCDGSKPKEITTTDTFYIHDTLTKVKLDSVDVIRYYPMPIYDTLTDTLQTDTTIIKVDTFYCDIPISKYTFDTTLAETQINGVVSGFEVELEQLTAINMKTATTTTKTPKKKRFGLGVNVGYGVGVNDNKVYTTPFIGLGLSYNILNF